MIDFKLDFRLKEETLKRCHIFKLDAGSARKFIPINPELFHFLYDIPTINFAIYFRVGEVMIQFIRPEEFSKELLDQLWLAMQKNQRRLEINIAKVDFTKFEDLIDTVRRQKVRLLVEKDPHLDRKVIDVFQNLSGASQLVVKGGINHQVVERIRLSASYMVNNLMDSLSAVSTLSRMVVHDPTLYDHSASVAMFAGMIALNCLKKPLSPKEAEVVAQCGLYHDVGKTCVPSAVLNKPGRFTPEEFEVMKSHTLLGEQELMRTIEEGAPIDEIAVRVAGEHHERFTGKGYPRGRRGRDEDDAEFGIHLYSRIVTIADVYSALLMKRVYKPAYEPQDAIKVMAETANDDYDPDIFPAFLRQVVGSLNDYQYKTKGKTLGRILVIDEDGKLKERKSA